MKFLVDNQLPKALARFLASRGVDCQHVRDVDLGAERLWPKIEAGLKAGDRVIELR